MIKKSKNALTMKTLTKSNVWNVQENDVFRLWEMAEKDADLKDNMRHYIDILRSAFEIEEVKADKPEIIKKYEDRGFKIGSIKAEDGAKVKWAIKKRPIMRVTDLTYENIRHISAHKLLEVIDRNFGGGWDSLPQSIKDVIEHGFEICTTTLPKDRLHKAGGMYEKKKQDGFDVLEIPKGTWIEAIFAKEKSELEESQTRIKDQEDDALSSLPNIESENGDQTEREGKYNDEDEDSYDEDKLMEESYRTTFETEPEDLDLEAEDVSDEEGF